MSRGKHIFLCGFMGCGKSTHGKKIARLLKMSFVDLDKYIQEKENKTIQFIFDHEGETEFRKLESHYLNEIINSDSGSVISLGGGTVCFNSNLNIIKEKGILVYIQMPPEALSDRLQNSKQKRPLLKNITSENLLSFIREKLKERDEYYLQADIIINGIDLNHLHLYKLLIEQRD